MRAKIMLFSKNLFSFYFNLSKNVLVYYISAFTSPSDSEVSHFQLRFGGSIVNGLPLACTDVQYFRFNFLFKHNIYFLLVNEALLQPLLRGVLHPHSWGTSRGHSWGPPIPHEWGILRGYEYPLSWVTVTVPSRCRRCCQPRLCALVVHRPGDGVQRSGYQGYGRCNFTPIVRRHA